MDGPAFPEIDPKNPLKMGRRRLHFGGFGVPFWKHFRGRGLPFWLHFGVPGGFWTSSASSGASGRPQNEFSDRYPFPAAPFWFQVGFPNRAQIDKKSKQKSIKKTMPLKIGFRSDFDGFLERKRRHLGTKNASKIVFSENVKKRIWS